MKHFLGAALGTAILVGFGSSAFADEAWRTNHPDDWRARQPFLMIELRFGPYHPDVDGGVGTLIDPATNNPVGPYDYMFGDSTRFLFSAEVDWEPIHIEQFGSIGAGGLVGYTSSSGKTISLDDNSRTAETTSLTIFPMAALGVARADVISRELGIPLVPYVKAGPAIGFWSSSNGSGVSRARDPNLPTTTRPNGELGRGHTGGFAYAIGISFLLDALDRQAAKTFAIEQGIQHSYVFAEYTVLQLHGLAQSNPMWIGDKTWNVGFAFEL